MNITKIPIFIIFILFAHGINAPAKEIPLPDTTDNQAINEVNVIIAGSVQELAPRTGLRIKIEIRNLSGVMVGPLAHPWSSSILVTAPGGNNTLDWGPLQIQQSPRYFDRRDMEEPSLDSAIFQPIFLSPQCAAVGNAYLISKWNKNEPTFLFTDPGEYKIQVLYKIKHSQKILEIKSNVISVVVREPNVFEKNNASALQLLTSVANIYSPNTLDDMPYGQSFIQHVFSTHNEVLNSIEIFSQQKDSPYKPFADLFLAKCKMNGVTLNDKIFVKRDINGVKELLANLAQDDSFVFAPEVAFTLCKIDPKNLDLEKRTLEKWYDSQEFFMARLATSLQQPKDKRLYVRYIHQIEQIQCVLNSGNTELYNNSVSGSARTLEHEGGHKFEDAGNGQASKRP